MKAENKSPYSHFARFYDEVMERVDYKNWYYFIRSIWLLKASGYFGRRGAHSTPLRTGESSPAKDNLAANIKKKLSGNSGNRPKKLKDFQFLINFSYKKAFKQCEILEIGCGTGILTIPFHNDKCSITGLDISLPMLEVLDNKASKKIPLICADMRNFFINKKFDFIFSVHDSVNYLTSPGDVKIFFQNVRSHLKNDGIFLFDLATEYNIIKNFYKKKDEYRLGDVHIKWHNDYSYREKIITSTLYFKNIKNNNIKDIYERHRQKIYNHIEIENIIAQSGFTILGVFGEQSLSPPDAKSNMISYILQEK